MPDLNFKISVASKSKLNVLKAYHNKKAHVYQSELMENAIESEYKKMIKKGLK